MSRSLAQQRSAFALEQVGQPKGDRNSFGKLVSGLPAMILQNGFGQTLAFLLAKGTGDGKIKEGDKHIEAFDIMQSWLVERGILKAANRRSTLKTVSEISQADYLHAQEEALALLEWVKRYANAGIFS